MASRLFDAWLNPRDPSELLAKLPKSADGTEYLTPYGFSIKRGLVDLYAYKYDADLPLVGPMPDGCCSGDDVYQILTVLERNPDFLRIKPESIVKLERLTGLTAVRKVNAFGGWHMRNDKFSLFNNPFSLSLGYTDSADNFEIWIFPEKDPRQYVSLEDVESLIYVVMNE